MVWFGGSWNLRTLSMTARDAGAGHAFAEAAFGQEITLQSTELSVQKEVGLVDEADEDIGHGLARA